MNRRTTLFAGSALTTALLASAALLTGCGSTDVYAEARTPQVQYDAQVQAGAQVDAQPQQPAGDEYQDTDPSALTDFQEPLQPYGVWVEDPNYGTVWVPNADAVGPDFAPYQTAGHWAMTDDEQWIWVSDYDWGYVPFHYGRWVWIDGRGWCWIPGRTYAPAWVVWRTGDAGYIGWAPMPPTWYWYDGYATSLWIVPPAPFVFCSTEYVFYDHVTTYVVRDRAVISSAAAGTHPYHAAQPTIGSHSSASPDSGHANSSAWHGGHGPMSPSLHEAGISPAAVSKIPHVTHDARATSLAMKPSGQATTRNGQAPGSNFNGHQPPPFRTSRASGASIGRSSPQDTFTNRGNPAQAPVRSIGQQQPIARPAGPSDAHAHAPVFHTPAPTHIPQASPSQAPQPQVHSSSPSHSPPAVHSSGPPPSTSRSSAPAPRSSGGAKSSGRSGGHHR